MPEIPWLRDSWHCCLLQLSKMSLNVVDKELIEKLRKKYYESPPDGMTKQDILHMSDSDLLDMDYFLTDEDDEDIGEEGFYIFN